jgi:hypothetical protein
VKRLVLVALALAGCAADPCDGKGPVCVSVRVEGSAPPLDRFDLDVTLASGRHVRGHTDPVAPAIQLPVAFALRLDDTPEARGGLGLALVGSASGVPRAAGVVAFTVPQSGHAAVTVELASLSGGDAAADGARDAATDAFVSIEGGVVDAQPPGDGNPWGSITLSATPDPTDILVGTTGTVRYTLNNGSAASILVSGQATQSTPLGIPIAFSTNNCLGFMVASGGSCTFSVNVSPTARAQWSLHMSVTYAGGSAATSSAVNAVEWANETVAVSNLLAVGGTSASDVWAAGAAGTILHKAGGGITAWTGPLTVPSTGTINSVYAAPGTTHVYFTFTSPSLYQYDSFASSFTAYSAPLAQAGNLIALYANSENDMFVLSSTGEILRGQWLLMAQSRAPDGNLFTQLGGVPGGDVWTVGANGTWARLSGGSWSSTQSFSSSVFNAVWTSGAHTYIAGARSGHGTVLSYDAALNATYTDFTNTVMNGIWGSSDSDVYVVGSGGAVYHLSSAAGAWLAEPTGLAPDLYGVWGAGGEVFAVGANGTIVHRY